MEMLILGDILRGMLRTGLFPTLQELFPEPTVSHSTLVFPLLYYDLFHSNFISWGLKSS